MTWRSVTSPLQGFFKEPTAGRTAASRYLVPPPDIALRGVGGVDVSSRDVERTVNMVGSRGTRVRRFGTSALQQNAMVLAGCRSDQTSCDAWIDNDNRGAFTYSLWRTLSDGGFSMSYAQLIEGAGAWLTEHGYQQVPQLEARSGQDALPFLGLEASAPRPRGREVEREDAASARARPRPARVKNGGHRRPGTVAPAR